MSFFRNYLSGRSQLVIFDSVASEKIPVTVGVPQGSILGPLLFLLYINDLPLATENSTATMFADDSTFHSTSKSLPTLEATLNREVTHITTWCDDNRMCPNSSKTKTMLVTTAAKRAKLSEKTMDIKMDGIALENVDSEKLLGVIIEQNLSWSKHIDRVCSKIKSKLYLLSRIRTYLPRSARKQFFNSFILPHFDYCLSVWGNCTVKDSQRLDRLLKKSMRLILNCNLDTPSHVMFRTLKWFPIRFRYKHKIAISVYKGLNGLAPGYISDLIDYYNPDTNVLLRSVEDKKLDVPFSRSELFIKAFSISGPNTYNLLPMQSCPEIWK